MVFGKKIVVVMPAYNAEKTLRETYSEIPHEYVDDIILVDDASGDNTANLAKELNIKTFVHLKNKGYGGNQKTCYREALKRELKIVKSGRSLMLFHRWFRSYLLGISC